MSFLIIVIMWLVLFAATMLAVSTGLKYLEIQRRKKVTGMLRGVSDQMASTTSTVLKGAERPDENSVRFKMSGWPVVKQWESLIAQSGLDWSVLGMLGLICAGALIGVLAGSRVYVPVFREFAMLAGCGLMGAAPCLYVLSKRRKRLAQFEEEFPEALDFLARSMRAGHALSVSLEMLADEAPEPLGIEFRRVFHEQNLGAPLDEALRNLTDRVPLLDVKFFVSSVLMQRETGGNLAEILTKLGYIIRERFRLKGQVRAMSAHGRLTAIILTILPIVTMFGLMIVAPGYLDSMGQDPDGKYLIIGAIAGQMVGYYIMRRIIDIKV
ncbi:MAG TPA: type II secretion system F family protein [Bryobacteraceae bacterium]|nr:type II secretion system F family protein [Bryobacteraceae bacterium]